jgi:penicillin-binding protein 1A
VGGKTGTTQDFRDAWFVGYTSSFTAGVWVGNDDGKPMNHTTGGSLPAEIWNRVMQVANRGLPPSPLPGTALIARDDGMSEGNALARTSSLRAPRVVQIHEELPWLARLKSAYGLSGQRQVVSAPPRSYVAQPPHPIRSIGEDFIAQAIAETDARDRAEGRAGLRPPETALEPAPFANW